MKDPLAHHKTIKLASDYSKIGTVEDFKNVIEFMNGMDERKHMSNDIVWYKCSEQLPDDDVSKDIFIILKHIPHAVFTCYYSATAVPQKPFYIHGVGFVEPDKILRWAKVPDGFMPKFDVKELVEYEDSIP